MVAGASLVCNVEHQVSGHRGAIGDLRRLAVADLADQDDVGVLAQHGAQRPSEGQADLGVDLDLTHARDGVFDRILDGDDVGASVPDRVEHGVQRGGLAAAGGASDQDDSFPARKDRIDGVGLVGREPERTQAQQLATVVQNPNHDLLAVLGGQRRHAKVHRPPRVSPPDRAVLRQPSFRNVERGEDLEAGDERGMQRAREREGLGQEAVDAVPREAGVGFRLHV
jgi:hypothetical protein